MRKLPILLIAFALPTLAQQVTTFEEAVQSAAQFNTDLRAARANAAAAEQRVKSASSGFLPEVSANVSYSDSSGGASNADTSYSAGVTATLVMSQIVGWGATITAGAIILAFSFSAAIGLLFGIYPARRAAALNPIEALRYE